MTAAPVTSPDVAGQALSAATVELPDLPDLLGLLPVRAAFSWVRSGDGLVGWGEAARLEVSGPGALAEAAAWWDALTGRLGGHDPVAVPGSGPVVFASIAFDPAAGTSVFVVPRVVVGRRTGRAWTTTIGPPDPRPARTRLRTAPSQVDYVDGALGPGAWSAAVAEAVRRIGTRELAKVVLARDLIAVADRPLDARRLLIRLADRFPDCWTFAVDGLLGATPELLLRRTGGQLSARVLAGTGLRGTPAGDDPRATPDDSSGENRGNDARLGADLLASDKDRAEHALAVESLVQALAPFCVDLSVPAEPAVLALANVVHLATDVTGTQRPPEGAGRRGSLLDLVAAAHPTAAVGGSPPDRAAALIAELEGMDRGRYAGPVGWLDTRGDGEFGLALRCAELDAAHPERARLFAGCGIVAGSDPDTELAETRAKFAAFQAALES